MAGVQHFPRRSGRFQAQDPRIPRDERDKVKPGEVAERHRNEYETLLLFEDLFNYKAKLAGVACMPTEAQESLAASRAIASPSSDDAEAIGGIVLESCVEWSTVEQQISNSVQPA